MEHYRLLADALAYQSAVCACERTSPLSAGRAAIRLLDRLSSGAAFRWLKKDRRFWSESQKDVEKKWGYCCWFTKWDEIWLGAIQT